MNKLKKILFKRAVMYSKAMKNSTSVEEVETYSTAYLAVHEVIAEAGLVDKFQDYVIKNRGVKK